MIETQSFKNLEERISYLEERVNRLELQDKYLKMQKQWDTSLTRIVVTSFLTYLFVVLLMYLLDIENFLLNALVPALGFGLTVQSVPFIKKLWIRRYLEEVREEKEEQHENDTGDVFKT